MSTNFVSAILAFFAGISLLLFLFRCIHLVAKAARMKNRSYNTFWFLSFLLTPMIVWTIVATLPFNEYDPRSPFSDTRKGEPLEGRYINKWALVPLVSKSDKIWLWVTAGTFVLCMLVTFILIAVTLRNSYY